MNLETPYPRARSVLLDFDSVICARESMDILFEYLLEGSPEEARRAILDEVTRITVAGMNGEIPFSEALRRRLAALPGKPVNFSEIAVSVRACLADTFLRHAPDWNWENIHIVSSGFRQIIQPALSRINVPLDHIHCNDLTVSADGVITGVDPSNPLAGDDGKTRIVRSLQLPREIVMVGDGYTDLQVAQSGEADYFFACVEFVRREPVIEQAAELIEDFAHLTKLLRL
ncbi:MAG: haloacid dehalogenase-like hydrolase [Candidatus Zixiibacteriota bacterium]